MSTIELNGVAHDLMSVRAMIATPGLYPASLFALVQGRQTGARFKMGQVLSGAGVVAHKGALGCLRSYSSCRLRMRRRFASRAN